jgi:hypothetical protein
MTTGERTQATAYLGMIAHGLAEGSTAKERERGRAALVLLWDVIGEAHGAESHARRQPRKAKATTDGPTA